MSDGTDAAAGGTTTKVEDRTTSALGNAAPDATKNGATGKETPAGNGNANAAGANDKGAAGKEAEGDKAPEAFDFTKWEPKLPEGVTPSKDVLEKFRPLAKELGLKGDGAQRLFDLWSANAKADVEAQLKSVEDNRSKSWESLKADKDMGGQNFDASIKTAQRAVRELGGAELADRLFQLGLDNDPTIVKAFVKAGKLFAEDKVGETASAPGTEKADTFQDRVNRTYKSKE